METLTNGVINVHVDPKDKEEATEILKDSYSNDLENALKESTIMEKEMATIMLMKWWGLF